MWALGATAVSIVLTIVDGENKYSALLPMIGLMLASSAAYRFMPALRERSAFVVILSLTTGLIFSLSAAATGFGSVEPIHWQALAPTGPFVLLLTLAKGWRFRVVWAVCWALVVVVVSASVYPSSPTAARIVLVAGTVGLGFSTLWAAFQILLYRLGAQAERSIRAEHDALLRADLVDATQKANLRWSNAGLESAITLLREIAEGRRDLHDEETRRASEVEERYLRQIVQLSPQLVGLSRVLPETLSHARERGVNYFLHLGDSDAPDDASARGIASAIKGVTSDLNPGHDLRVSIYPVEDGLRLTLVAPGIRSPSHSTEQVRHERIGPVDLVEITYPRDTAMAPAT